VLISAVSVGSLILLARDYVVLQRRLLPDNDLGLLTVNCLSSDVSQDFVEALSDGSRGCRRSLAKGDSKKERSFSAVAQRLS